MKVHFESQPKENKTSSEQNSKQNSFTEDRNISSKVKEIVNRNSIGHTKSGRINGFVNFFFMRWPLAINCLKHG